MIKLIERRIEKIRKVSTNFSTIEQLELRGIGLSYVSSDEGAIEKEKVVFKDLNFNFSLNDNYLFEGSMGSGRSSLMKVLAGLLVPQVGSYLINGHDVLQMSFEEFLPYRLHIGYTFDYGGLLANRTLKDNLLIPLLYHKIMSPKEAEEQVQYLLKMFKIIGHENQRPASVSGAMRKATVVARGFILNPELLVMDDPFVGLNDEQGETIVALINEHREKKGLKHVFYSTRYERFVRLLGGKSITVQNSNFGAEMKRSA